ncbi:MAG: hypothetical protein AAF357_00335 [Verrucomicrobiota bacterium]
MKHRIQQIAPTFDEVEARAAGRPVCELSDRDLLILSPRYPRCGDDLIRRMDARKATIASMNERMGEHEEAIAGLVEEIEHRLDEMPACARNGFLAAVKQRLVDLYS